MISPATLWARLRARLIDDVRQAHHFWSTRITAIGAAVMAGLGLFSTEFPGAWGALPGDLREKMPSWIGFALLVAGLVARLVKQKDRHHGE